MQYIETPNHEIDMYELLIVVNKHYRKEKTNFQRKKDLQDMQKSLLDKIDQSIKFNNMIQSKCKCEPPKIHKRVLSNGDKPHVLTCSECISFCSNCSDVAHTPDKPHSFINTSCEKLAFYRQITNYSQTQLWLAELRGNIESINRIKEEIENNNKMKDFLNYRDVRICPYCTWQGARAYESAQLGHGRITTKEALTYQYDEKNWFKVKCKSDEIPVTKEYCDDVTCGSHNIENQHYTDGKSNKCCGRRISWIYWTPFKPKFDKPKQFTQNEITKRTLSISSDDVYICSCCKHETNAMYVICADSACQNTKVCMNCYVNPNTTVKITIINNTSGEIQNAQMSYNPTSSYCFHFMMDDMNIGTYYNIVLNTFYFVTQNSVEPINIPKNQLDFFTDGIYGDIIFSTQHNLSNTQYNLSFIVEGNNKCKCLHNNHDVIITDYAKIEKIMSNYKINNKVVSRSPDTYFTNKVKKSIMNKIFFIKEKARHFKRYVQINKYKIFEDFVANAVLHYQPQYYYYPDFITKCFDIASAFIGIPLLLSVSIANCCHATERICNSKPYKVDIISKETNIIYFYYLAVLHAIKTPVISYNAYQMSIGNGFKSRIKSVLKTKNLYISIGFFALARYLHWKK